jgi:WD40 repeat protein
MHAIRVFEGHQGEVNGVAFVQGGRQVLTGGHDALRLWDTATGRELRRHDLAVRRLAGSPDGRLALLTRDDVFDHALHVWDVENWREERQLQGHRGKVLAVAFSPDGRRALSGGGNGWRDVKTRTKDFAVRLWDVEAGREVRRLEGHTGPVTGLAFAPDGRRALTASSDETIRLWDLDTGRELQRRGQAKQTTEENWCPPVAYAPNGKQALLPRPRFSGSTDLFALWDVEAWREVCRFGEGPDHQDYGSALCLAFSPDGGRIVSGSDTGKLRLWDVGTGREVAGVYAQRSEAAVLCVAFAPDGRSAVAGSRGDGGFPAPERGKTGSDCAVRLRRLPE